jgi:hypothetical protein
MKKSWSAALLGMGMLASGSALRAHGAPEFSMSVLVDGSLVPEYASRGRVYVEALKGREFTIRLTNPTSGRVAVALSVDGRNVIDAKRTSERSATKWVLDPGETVDIPGWQISGETSRRFFFTETSHSYAKWLGDTANVGTIEAVFFREKRRNPPLAVTKDAEARKRDDAAAGVEGGVPGGVMGGVAGSTETVPRPSAPLRQAQAETKVRAADEYAATGIGDRTAFPVSWVEFEADPVPAARVAIRYEYRAELVRLGVLPRADDGLAARERARGFDHGYAPDPGAAR